MDPLEENEGGEKNTKAVYKGTVINSRRREEIQQNISAEEAEYEKWRSRRPDMGSGIVGGKTLSCKYSPTDREIMEIMQQCDIEWDDAKLFLVQEYMQNLDVASGAAQAPSSHSAAVRQQRLKSITQPAKDRAKQRELAEQQARLHEEEVIARRKELARRKGQVLEEKQLKQHTEQRFERIDHRLRVFSQETSPPAPAPYPTHTVHKVPTANRYRLAPSQYASMTAPPDPSPPPVPPVESLEQVHAAPSSKKISARPQTQSEEVRRLRDEVTGLDAINQRLRQEVAALHQQLRTQEPIPQQTCVHTVSSSEWRALLACTPSLQQRVVLAMAEQVGRAECGECMYPSLEYTISSEMDRYAVSWGGGENAAGESVDTTSDEEVGGNHSAQENRGEGDNDESAANSSTSLNKEELRRMRLKHLSSGSIANLITNSSS